MAGEMEQSIGRDISLSILINTSRQSIILRIALIASTSL